MWRLLLLLLLVVVGPRPHHAHRSDDPTAGPVNGLSCIFCENVQSNFICNRFAIDTPCPAGTEFCRTLHIMDWSGVSLVVNKHCATADQCREDQVGCLQQDRQRTCVSCCDDSFCNVPVPTNYSNAVLDIKPTAPTRAVTSAGAGHAVRWRRAVLLTTLRLALIDTG
ncbi:ly6/PLAUR domain-containing protein 6B-like [Pollicipes pollicipes]|uniref:ly6/PLAUR domain-containing protein 6B-like n=1 Tax=Pollicipes pollicipes TaxID=41117 RepID=UPI00188566C9|nr:ly6/PLAUR domain-containing protein 6B-like [Pollicipes pollicipes]